MTPNPDLAIPESFRRTANEGSAMTTETPTQPATKKRRSRTKIDQVWVLGIDDGTEGKQPPHTAFLTEQEANQAKQLVEVAGTTLAYIACVPVWK